MRAANDNCPAFAKIYRLRRETQKEIEAVEQWELQRLLELLTSVGRA